MCQIWFYNTAKDSFSLIVLSGGRKGEEQQLRKLNPCKLKAYALYFHQTTHFAGVFFVFSF